MLPKVAVAVNCCVVVGLIHAPVGDSAIAMIESEAGKKPPQLVSSRAANTATAVVKKANPRMIFVPLLCTGTLSRLNDVSTGALSCPHLLEAGCKSVF